MSSDPAAQWAFAVLFAALAAHSLWRLVTDRGPFATVGYLLHLGMNLVMVAMVWPWWTRLPVLPQLAFFALAAAFFAAAAGWYAVDALARVPVADRSAQGARRAGHHESARALAAHAVMMLAMAWAVAAMSPGSPGASPLAGAGQSARHVVGHPSGHASGLLADHAQTGAWNEAAGWLLVAALVAGGAWYVTALARHRRCCGSVRDRTGVDLLASAATSVGTAAMCVLMLTG